jgi:hypothetical protein
MFRRSSSPVVGLSQMKDIKPDALLRGHVAGNGDIVLLPFSCPRLHLFRVHAVEAFFRNAGNVGFGFGNEFVVRVIGRREIYCIFVNRNLLPFPHFEPGGTGHIFFLCRSLQGRRYRHSIQFYIKLHPRRYAKLLYLIRVAFRFEYQVTFLALRLVRDAAPERFVVIGIPVADITVEERGNGKMICEIEGYHAVTDGPGLVVGHAAKAFGMNAQFPCRPKA